MNTSSFVPQWKKKGEEGKTARVVRKVVRRQSYGHQANSSWKLAYADFATAMMALFLALWLINIDSGMKGAIQAYFTDPIGFKRSLAAGNNVLMSSDNATSTGDLPDGSPSVLPARELRQLEVLMARLRRRLEEAGFPGPLDGRVEIVLTKDGLRIELIESGQGQTYFGLGSAEPSLAAKYGLELIGSEIAKVNNSIVLEGHTDARQYGDNIRYTNWELSVARANAARWILEGAGVKAERVLEVRGYADRQLRVPNDPLASSNRRVSILVLPRELISVSDREIQ